MAERFEEGMAELKWTGARDIKARSVTIRQGGALGVRAEDVRITQGGIALASGENIRVTAGSVGAVLADRARLEQTATSLAAARERVVLDQSAAGVVVGRTVTARDSVIGLAIAPRLDVANARILMGPRAALAFGAGVGIALALARLWRRR